MSEHSNVTEFPAERFPRNGIGHGSDLRQRLRKVEIEVNTINTQLENCATKRDICKLKIWALCGGLAGTFGALVWVVRMLLERAAP